MICYKKVALLLALSFCLAQCDHTHEHNHQGDKSPDSLSAWDHAYHDYHHHHPIEPPNCGQVCPRSVSKYAQFEVGQVYTVDLDGQTLINVKEGQTVSIKAKVDVHVLTPCEFALKIKDAEVTGVPNPTELSGELNASPELKFGAHDGKILGVCPAPQEAIWTLNVKKSILSAMQVTTKDLTQTQTVEEVDFSGHCTTTYRPLSETADTKNLILEKTKNLNKCHLRRKNLYGFNTKSLSLLTEFLRENLPLLKGTQRCNQEIKAGHLFSVSCTEEHILSFQDDSLVRSSLNLRFVGKTPATGPVTLPATVPTNAQSLLISRDNEDQRNATEPEVLSLLKTMCSQVSGDKLSPQITESFHQLVHSLRTLPESGTRTLDKAVKTGELCPSPKLRMLFVGASAFAASDPAIQTIINAYKSGELPETPMTILLSFVALKARPTEKTIEQYVSLIEKSHSPRPLVLGVSLIVRNYCRKVENCEAKPAVKKITDVLLKKLQESDCDIERITTIKALDNIRCGCQGVKDGLTQWAQKSDADSGVRIAAIQALQRIADDTIRQKLIELTLKDSEPNEIRTTAYRSVVLSGATQEQMDTINTITDPQIQNYIRTHIRNLKHSSAANRRKLAEKGANIAEPKNTGFGTTRNAEWSYRGLTLESDVVYPKGSYVPSLYTFGTYYPVGDKEWQLLEVQIRQQGLDEHLKKLFAKGFGGPEVMIQFTGQLMEVLNQLKDPNHKHTTRLQLTVRLAGKNVLFVDTLEDIHNAVALIRKALKEGYVNSDNIDSARALAILDSMVEVPTINGFPLLIHYNETIILGMKGEYSVQESGGNRVRKIKRVGQYVDDLSAGLRLKVRNYRPGFQYVARLEMFPTIDAQSERIDGRILKLKFNLPAERKTVLKLSQTTRLIDGNGVPRVSNEVSNERLTSDENTRCRQLFGLNVCKSKVWLDNSPIPNLEYYYTKADPSLESIDLTLERPAPDATGDLKTWTAKAKAGERKYLAQIDLQNPSTGYPKKVSAKLQSPRRTITADVSLDKQQNGNVSNLEVDLKVPEVIDVNTKYHVEKVGEQSNVDVVVEYKSANSDRKETLRWTRKSSLEYKRDKKTKQINVSLFGELQSTQWPRYNSKLTYYTQLRPYQNSKTDLSVEWGPELKDRVRVSHTSKMDVIELRPFQMVSENAFLLEATPLDINYDFKVNTDLAMIKSKPKLLSIKLVGKDVNGRPNREIRGDLKYESLEAPIQQIVNASLAYPGNEVTYYSEVKQIKDLTYSGKVVYSPSKGKVITIDHKESITNPTQNFYVKVDAKLSYSWKPETKAVTAEGGWAEPELFKYKRVLLVNDKKVNNLDVTYNKATGALQAQGTCEFHDRAADLKVDNIYNPKSAQWGLRVGQKSYKFSASRVPKESITVKLDSSENSRLKEFKAKVSRKDRSSINVVTSDNVQVNAWIDPYSGKEKRAHLDFKSPKYNIDHVGDIVLNKVDRKATWESKTNKDGKPWVTVDAVYQPRQRSYFILKKIKSSDAVSKVEYFYDKGVYGAVVDTSTYSAVLEGEYRDGKRFGKLGFVNKLDNYEHKSHFNVSNGVLTIKSISDKDKESATKLDATIGCRIISEVNLITPKRKAHLKINPLTEPKTLVWEYVSEKYDQNANIDWVPKKYVKLVATHNRKVDPQKTVKVNAYLTRQDEATVRITAPRLDIDIKRVKTPKPQYVFNTTMNGYNEIQEFDSNPTLTPAQNFLIALGKWFKSYTANN